MEDMKATQEAAKAVAAFTANATAELKRLELLFDYTKFHIGLYLALTASYITLATTKAGGRFPKLHPNLVSIAVVCFLVAGLAGGIIASGITKCECATVKDFLGKWQGPWRLELFPGEWWTWIEHTAFWVGIVSAIFSFKFAK